MIRLTVEMDDRLANRLRRIQQGVKSRRARLALAAVALFVPVVAFAAPLTIPNTFTAGTVISSSEVNANFTAVQASVDDNDARITALEASFTAVQASVDDNDSRITALEAVVGPRDCTWAVDASTGPSTLRQANCPVGKHPISGGCSSGTLNVTLEWGIPMAPLISNGALVTVPTAWYCEFPTAGTAHKAYALCCAF